MTRITYLILNVFLLACCLQSYAQEKNQISILGPEVLKFTGVVQGIEFDQKTCDKNGQTLVQVRIEYIIHIGRAVTCSAVPGNEVILLVESKIIDNGVALLDVGEVYVFLAKERLCPNMTESILTTFNYTTK